MSLRVLSGHLRAVLRPKRPEPRVWARWQREACGLIHFGPMGPFGVFAKTFRVDGYYELMLIASGLFLRMDGYSDWMTLLSDSCFSNGRWFWNF